jgi:hypothetical protein
MKKNYKFLIVFFVLICLILFFIRRETFSNMDSLLEDTSNRKDLRTQIVKNTEKIIKHPSLFNINESNSDEILNRYINKHLLSNKPNNLVTPEKSTDLNNDTLKVLQFIQLNELKLILERINRIEDLNINCKKEN